LKRECFTHTIIKRSFSFIMLLPLPISMPSPPAIITSIMMQIKLLARVAPGRTNMPLGSSKVDLVSDVTNYMDIEVALHIIQVYTFNSASLMSLLKRLVARVPIKGAVVLRLEEQGISLEAAALILGLSSQVAMEEMEGIIPMSLLQKACLLVAKLRLELFLG
jgi:hypothetical protein